jgi:AcrR family transcriptional regulator
MLAEIVGIFTFVSIKNMCYFMQIRKKKIIDTLLENAEVEFYKYGFEHASIRRIIKTSGMTIGNFYNYFRNKEALFLALVDEEYQKFMHFMTQQEHETGSGFKSDFMQQPDWRKQLPMLLHNLLPEFTSAVLPDFNRRFVILIEGSAGTKFENIRDRLKTLVIEHLKQHIEEAGVFVSDDICNLLSTQFIDGVVSIIKQEISNKNARHNLLANYMIFYVSGIAGLLGAEY